MNNNINESIFIKIYKEYKKYIELGIYKNGDKLPSIRAVASEQGINPNTVQRAFKMLENEGLIESINKKGLYVTHDAREEKIKYSLLKQFTKLKEEGLSKELILKVIEEVYND